jgi:hypothetical protein
MGVRSILDVLRDQRYGELHDELSNAMNELVKSVENTQKAGSLTLTLKIKPSTAGALELSDEIKLKKPELPKGASLFFATPEGNLTRNDPRQQALPGIRSVEENQSPNKEVKVA